LRTHILKGDIYLAANLPVSVVGDANTTRFCDPFETHCNIDAITKDIIVFDDNITDVNADAKFDPLVLRHIGILLCHAALDFVGTAYGVDHAGELNERAVPGILDDPSAMIGDFGIKKRLSKSFQLRQRAFFVDPYQAARARDIRRQNSRQSPLYMVAAQDAPPGLGELNVLYSTIVDRCSAMPTSEMGHEETWTLIRSLRRRASARSERDPIRFLFRPCVQRAVSGQPHFSPDLHGCVTRAVHDMIPEHKQTSTL
jgi:hypothetical protein